jgi:microcystin-dependent protein
MYEPLIGQLEVYPYNFAPNSWLPCDGRLISIAEYTALFSLLGTTYGGDGEYNFALPDLRGRVAVSHGQGPGLSPYYMGQQGGSPTVTLVSTQLPAHSHELKASSNSTVSAPQGNFPGPLVSSSGDAVNGYDPTPEADLAPAALLPVGGSQPHENLPPYLAIGWFIATEGYYPSRN